MKPSKPLLGMHNNGYRSISSQGNSPPEALSFIAKYFKIVYLQEKQSPEIHSIMEVFQNVSQ